MVEAVTAGAHASRPLLERITHRLSLRARMVLLAGVTVTVVLVVATVLLGAALRASLVDNLAQVAVVRAHEVAELARQSLLPPTLPVVDDDEAFVQVVRGGEVIAASGNVAGLPAIREPSPRPDDVAVQDVRRLPYADEDDDESEGGFLVAALTTATPDGATTVYTGASLEDVQETLAEAAGIAAAGLPLVVVALAASMWLVVGRTLAPVEHIRAEAEGIGGSELSRRVPDSGRDDEIGRLARTLNAMLARMEDSFQQQRRFVADAAHELRSPVANVRSQLETARESRDAVDWDQRSSILLEDAIRMQRLIEQLLLLARLDAGSTADRRAVDLDDIVLSVAGRLDGRPGIAIDLAKVAPVQISGDPTLIEQLVVNLLDNAVRHARHAVHVTTGTDGEGAYAQVDDDGTGIPSDRRDDVLRRFTRLQDARDRDSGGVGLGLAIAADIAHAHAGTIEVADSTLGGASLRARLGQR